MCCPPSYLTSSNVAFWRNSTRLWALSIGRGWLPASGTLWPVLPCPFQVLWSDGSHGTLLHTCTHWLAGGSKPRVSFPVLAELWYCLEIFSRELMTEPKKVVFLTVWPGKIKPFQQSLPFCWKTLWDLHKWVCAKERPHSKAASTILVLGI